MYFTEEHEVFRQSFRDFFKKRSGSSRGQVGGSRFY